MASDSVGAISPAGGAIAAAIPVGSSPSSVAAGDGAVWVTNYNDNTSRGSTRRRARRADDPGRIRPRAGSRSAPARCGSRTTSAGPCRGSTRRSNRVVGQPITVGNGPSGVAVGYGSVWVTNSSDGTLSRINALTDAVVKTIALEGGATDVAVGFGAVWVSDEADGRVLRIDPQTDQVADSINVGTGPTAITVGYGSVWVANSLDGTVSRGSTRRPTRSRRRSRSATGRARSPSAPAACGSPTSSAGPSFGINPATNAVTRTIRVGNRPRGVAVAAGLVWVGAQASDAEPPWRHADSADQHARLTRSTRLCPGRLQRPLLTLYMTNDGLTAFKRVGGSDGGAGRARPGGLAPDADRRRAHLHVPAAARDPLLKRPARQARGLPPSDRTRFQAKPWTPSTPNTTSRSSAAQRASRTRRAVTFRAGSSPTTPPDTVTFHLVDPDPEFLAAARARVGRRGSRRNARTTTSDTTRCPRPVLTRSPATHPRTRSGSYVTRTSTSGHTRRARVASPTEIVWRIGASPDGRSNGGRARTRRLLARPARRPTGCARCKRASQASCTSTRPTTILMLLLNTRAAPFNDIRVRRALNYAIDRGEARPAAGPGVAAHLPAAPTLRSRISALLPVHAQPEPRAGLERSRPPEGPGPDRGLAHARHAHHDLERTRFYLTDFTATGRYLVSLLDRLGYPHGSRRSPTKTPHSFYQLADSRTRAQAFLIISARTTRPRRSSSARIGTAARASCRARRVTPTFRSSATRSSTRSSGVRLPPKPPARRPPPSCGRKPTGNTPTRRRSCHSSRRASPTSSPTASATTNTTRSSAS